MRPIHFHTNIDVYSSITWDESYKESIPRVDEELLIPDLYHDACAKKGLPIVLRVVGVLYSQRSIVVELHLPKNILPEVQKRVFDTHYLF